MSDNNVFIGNLTRDPEIRFTTGGTAVVNTGLAVNRRWQDGSGEWQEKTSFFDVTVWDQQAINTSESLHKGTRVVVVGRLDINPWEAKDKKGVNVVITATEICPSLRWATAEVKKNARPDQEDRQP
jgi:single-strand DNA-binding protein